MPGAIVDIAPNFIIIETLFYIRDGIDHTFNKAFAWIKDIFISDETRSLAEAIARADFHEYPHGTPSGGEGQDLIADTWGLYQSGSFEKSPFDELTAGQIAPGQSSGHPDPAGADAEQAAAYAAWQAREQGRLELESSMAAAEGLVSLTTAIESGDGVTIARALVNSINAVDIAAMYQNQGQGSLFGEHRDLAHAGLSAVGNGLGLAQALQAGDNWNTVSGTAALVRDIDSFVQANGGGSFLGDRGGATLSALGSALSFGAALEGGDGWAIAASGLNLASDIGRYIDSGGKSLSLGPDAGSGLQALSGAASAAFLALNVRDLSDAFESGDVKDMAISGGHTVVSALGNAAVDRIVACPVPCGMLGSGAADDGYGILAA